MGDSAGGGLCLLTIQALLEHKLPVPRGVVVLSPWADLSASGESHIRNRHKDILLHNDENDWLLEQLLGPNYTQLSFLQKHVKSVLTSRLNKANISCIAIHCYSCIVQKREMHSRKLTNG